MLGLPELLLLGFAAYRGTQLLVWDSITQPIRDRIDVWHATHPKSAPAAFLHAVLACPYCAGMYVSGTALLVYLIAAGRWDDTSWLVHGVEWFAVAGIQALLNRRDDTWTSR